MTSNKPMYKTYIFAGLLLVALLCAACGSNVVRGAPPIVRMTELSHQDNMLSLQVSMRNLNGVKLDIQTIDFRLTVNDQEDELFVYNGPADTNIVANGTESWTVEIEESELSRELLNSLENGDIQSLPYELKGSVITKEEGKLRFEYEGHIYPLPGKPGHFR